METTLYTSCGRCRKPILLPSAGTVLTTTPTDATTPDQKAKLTLEPKPRPKPAGNYAYCLACKQSSSKCSIWSVIVFCLHRISLGADREALVIYLYEQCFSNAPYACMEVIKNVTKCTIYVDRQSISSPSSRPHRLNRQPLYL